jgi:hypothetical protein
MDKRRLTARSIILERAGTTQGARERRAAVLECDPVVHQAECLALLGRAHRHEIEPLPRQICIAGHWPGISPRIPSDVMECCSSLRNVLADPARECRVGNDK